VLKILKSNHLELNFEGIIIKKLTLNKIFGITVTTSIFSVFLSYYVDGLMI